MNTKQWFEREKYVALHAQRFWLRAIKYPIIIALLVLLSLWKGWMAAVSLLLFLLVAGTTLHFILRWKTKAWTESWGPYKKIELPE